MGHAYEALSAQLGVPLDGAVLTRLRAENAAEVVRLDAVVADARETHGVVELGAAVLKKAQYLGSIGDKEGALKAYAAMPEKALSTGGKADIAMACARLAFVSGDKRCVLGQADPTSATLPAPPPAPNPFTLACHAPCPALHPPKHACALPPSPPAWPGSWWSAWQRPRR
jgi:hypothetical protein